MIPAAFDYERADSVDDAVAAPRPPRRRRQAPRRRPLAAAADEAAAGHARRCSSTSAGSRPRPTCAPRATSCASVRSPATATSRRSDVLREAGAAARPRGRPGRRPAGAPPRARSAARSPTATRPPTCPPRCWPCGATLVARGPSGERAIAADDFFTGFLETALAPDEVLTEIRVPSTAGARVVVPEVQPAGPGLGHRRGGRACCNGSGRHRPREHGLGAGAGRRRGGGAGRRRRRPPTPPPGPTRASSRPPTSTPPPTTAGTWPGSSPAGPSRRPGG